ncbi:MAG TPA: c-type cytochrome [Thermoanaerobaculia bacterium]|nr:c-type cytochrome [Thermoanaerobaculia bacterium]
MPLRRLFALSSLAFLAVLGFTPVKNALRPYRALQREFTRIGVSRAPSSRAAVAYAARPIAIQQIWIPDFEDRVDRCTTCHLGVGDPVMAEAPQPFREHPPTHHTPRDFQRFGCTSCHSGEGLATDQADAHGTSADATSPILPTDSIEAGCGRCHTADAVPDAPTLSLGRALMAKSGCYACHAARGHEDFRSDAPPLETISMKTGGEWLRRWLSDPKAMDANTSMPNFRLAAEDIEALSHYLASRPVPPELRRAIENAASEPAGNAAHGKTLFAEARCISCHTVDSKGNGSAPELGKIASRASRPWLLAFLRDPHAFNAQTRMPQYNFSDADVRDLVAYFEDELKDFDAPANILEPVRVKQRLAERGEKLFKTDGCFACHGGVKEGERFGPDLYGIGDRKATSLDFGRRTDLPRTLAAWLAAKVTAPRSFANGLKMPTFAFDAAQRRAVVTALISMNAAAVPEPYRMTPALQAGIVPAGPIGTTISRYRCLSCHEIGSRGGDISTAPLTFEGSKVNRDWLAKYLTVPYSIRPILPERMPILHMSTEDARRLADAIEMLYVDPNIPEDPFAGRPDSDRDAAEGERLYTTLGCRACHIIGNNGGYYGPPLSDTRARLKPGWVFRYLLNPQRWRADVRCPNYGLSDTDALRLTAYLETLSASAPAKKVAAR